LTPAKGIQIAQVLCTVAASYPNRAASIFSHEIKVNPFINFSCKQFFVQIRIDFDKMWLESHFRCLHLPFAPLPANRKWQDAGDLVLHPNILAINP